MSNKKMREIMKKEPKLTEPRKIRKKLIKQLDDVFSLYIRNRDNWRCWGWALHPPKCSKIMQNNHKVSRINFRLRWDEKNAVCGCSSHNAWSHFNQSEWERIWKSWKDADYLSRARHETKHYSDEELKLLILHFKNKLPQVKS